MNSRQSDSKCDCCVVNRSLVPSAQDPGMRDDPTLAIFVTLGQARLSCSPLVQNATNMNGLAFYQQISPRQPICFLLVIILVSPLEAGEKVYIQLSLFKYSANITYKHLLFPLLQIVENLSDGDYCNRLFF